jgi:hypothetical protein
MVSRALVRPPPGVCHHHADGCAECFALKRAGKDLNSVGFLARRDDAGLAGTAAIQIRLDVGLGQFDARRTTIHDHTDASAVRFAPGGDAEQMTERVCHAWSVREKRRVVKSDGLPGIVFPLCRTFWTCLVSLIRLLPRNGDRF